LDLTLTLMIYIRICLSISLRQPPIPMSDTVDPLASLTDDAEIAQWNNFGLPSDRMSSENATILMNSQRWPLMIDPQLQGIKWIKNTYGQKLKVLRLGAKGYLEVIEKVRRGQTSYQLSSGIVEMGRSSI